MSTGTWFLVVADYEEGTSRVGRYNNNRAALKAYAHAEEVHRHKEFVEVVLIASDDEAALRKSYPHLFGARKTSKANALRMLNEVAYG